MSNDVTTDGLFGPGIFGTGIDLSALDADTAFRLGEFMGEQMKAAGANGYARARAEIAEKLWACASNAKLRLAKTVMETAERYAVIAEAHAYEWAARIAEGSDQDPTQSVP